MPSLPLGRHLNEQPSGEWDRHVRRNGVLIYSSFFDGKYYVWCRPSLRARKIPKSRKLRPKKRLRRKINPRLSRVSRLDFKATWAGEGATLAEAHVNMGYR